MKKEWIKWIVYIISFILYSSLVFIIPHEYTSKFWITYCFSVLAFIIFGVVFYYLVYRKNKEDVFLGISAVRVTLIYLLIQLLLSFAFIHIKNIPTWMVLLISILILCIALIVSLITIRSINYIRDVGEKNSKDED